jgi:hypothetical protein
MFKKLPFPASFLLVSLRLMAVLSRERRRGVVNSGKERAKVCSGDATKLRVCPF